MKKAIVAVCAFLLPAFALAQGTPSTPRIDKRQAAEQKRIDEGVKSGALTGKEAARLEKGQARIQRMEDKAVADGKVTPHEQRRIEHAQNQESRKIAREKHDRQTARK